MVQIKTHWLGFRTDLAKCYYTKELVDEFELLVNDKENYAFEYFSRLKMSVELEKANLKIDKLADRMLGDINKYENECKIYLKKIYSNAPFLMLENSLAKSISIHSVNS